MFFACLCKKQGQSRTLLSCRPADWKARLRGYGVAGVLAYGLLNTTYYTATFWYMWTLVYKVPRGRALSLDTCQNLTIGPVPS